jgi:hypothetical protein
VLASTVSWLELPCSATLLSILSVQGTVRIALLPMVLWCPYRTWWGWGAMFLEALCKMRCDVQRLACHAPRWHSSHCFPRLPRSWHSAIELSGSPLMPHPAKVSATLCPQHARLGNSCSLCSLGAMPVLPRAGVFLAGLVGGASFSPSQTLSKCLLCQQLPRALPAGARGGQAVSC